MKRTAGSLIWTFAIVAVLLAAAALFRIPLAETGIRWWFAREGLTRPDFRIERLDFDGIELADIAAGTDAALRIDRIDIVWSPATLAAGRAERFAITGLQARATIDENGLSIPGIDLPKDGDGGAVALPVLPGNRIDLADARLALTTPYGPIAATATASYTNIADATSLAVNGTAEGEPGRAGFSLSAESSAPGAIEGSLTLADGAVDIPALKIPSFGGSGHFAFANGRLADISGSLRAPTVETPTIPQLAAGRLDIEGSRNGDANALRLSFRETPVDHGMSIRATVSDIAVAGGTASANAQFTVTTVDYALAGIELRDLAATLPLALQSTGDTVTVTLADTGRIAASRIGTAEIATRAPVAITLPATATPLATITRSADGIGVDHALSAAVAPTRIAVAPPGMAARTLDLAATRVGFTGRHAAAVGYTGHATLANDAVTVDKPALKLQDVTGDLRITGLAGDGVLQLDLAGIHDSAPTPLFHPIGAAVEATRRNGRLTFVARLRDATQTVRAIASGPWPLAGPGDEITVEVPEIAFGRGGVQPSAFLPALSAIDVSSGSVRASGRIRRDGDALVTSGDASIANMSLAAAGADIAGLDASIQLDSLLPPTTPAGQEIAIDRVDLVTPLDDVRVVYRLADARGTPRVDIASLRAGLLGGTVRLADTSLTLDGTPADLPLAVERLDVAEMLALLGVEGIDGSGTLSGSLPLRLSPTVAEIRAGRLAADGPGVLRLDSAAAADFLAAQGPSVDLAVRALEDFHYSELTIDIARDTGGEARLALSMLGNNPAVLDAHPFRFNINLKSNVDSLIEALLKGYRIATDRVGRHTGSR